MVRVGTWNTKWASPDSERGRGVSAALAVPDCDVICLTEGYAEVLPDGGHVIDAGRDWGYATKEGRRKVLLWSKQPWSGPWSELNPDRSDWIPGGRFVAGTTQTDVGPLVVMGACVPWKGAHVSSGRKDREPWEDHERWLEGFTTRRLPQNSETTIVLGDFNQRIPRRSVPNRTHELLVRAFERFTIATAGNLSQAPGPAIDHIVHTPDLALVGDIGIWPRRNKQGETLSDHFGVWGCFEKYWDKEQLRKAAMERMSEPLPFDLDERTPEHDEYERKLAAAWKRFYDKHDESGLVALGVFPKGEPENAD